MRTEVWGGGEKEQITINRSIDGMIDDGTEETLHVVCWPVSKFVRRQPLWRWGDRHSVVRVTVFLWLFSAQLIVVDNTQSSPRVEGIDSADQIRSDPVSPHFACWTSFYLPARFNYYSLAALVCTSINHIGKLVFSVSCWVTLLDALQWSWVSWIFLSLSLSDSSDI